VPIAVTEKSISLRLRSRAINNSRRKRVGRIFTRSVALPPSRLPSFEGALCLEKDEDLQPQIVSWQEALAWALDGTIRDAKTLVAILLWDRLRTAKSS